MIKDYLEYADYENRIKPLDEELQQAVEDDDGEAQDEIRQYLLEELKAQVQRKKAALARAARRRRKAERLKGLQPTGGLGRQ